MAVQRVREVLRVKESSVRPGGSPAVPRRFPEAALAYQLFLIYHPMMAVTAAPDLARAAALFQALSDEKRLRILSMLGAGERCVCELAEDLDVGQSLLSFHLKTLKDAGLVTDRRDGRWIHYSVAPDALAGLTATLDGLAAGRPRLARRAC